MKISVLILLALTAVATSAELPPPKERTDVQPLLPTGFVFNGIEGTVTKLKDTDRWFFKSTEDALSGERTVKAGTKIELLPSSTLEAISVGVEKDNITTIKLWAKVTTYSNEYSKTRLTAKKTDAKKITTVNHLFPVYYLPIADAEKDRQPKDGTENNKADNKDNSILPEEVLQRFKPKRVVKLTRKVIDVQGDVVLVSRTGFARIDKNTKQFTLDSLGQKVDDIEFNILPCDRLIRIEKSLLSSAGRQRFAIAGTVTKYKGQYYILLQRAIRTYNHGNFAR